MDGKAKRDNIFTTILFSKKSLLIAISVADFIISSAGSSWWWQPCRSTVTYKQSLLVLNYLIFALVLQIEVELHRANQFTSVFKYWYIMEYNCLKRNHKWERLDRDLQSPFLICACDKCVMTGTSLCSQKNHHSFLRIMSIWNLLFFISLGKEQWSLHLRYAYYDLCKLNYCLLYLFRKRIVQALFKRLMGYSR